MEPTAEPPKNGDTGFSFPPLPIVTAPPARLNAHQKYGGLFYLGVGGLLVLVALVGWFAYGAWSLRSVWSNVYVLHEIRRPDAERIQAAYALSSDPRVNQRQRWDICLRRTIPDPGRYLIAESLSAEAAEADPRGYALTVARSDGWPNWLRLLLLRPMAYATIDGVRFPREPLDELMRHNDPLIRLWAAFVLAQQDEPKGGGSGLRRLQDVAAQPGPDGDLARMLARLCGSEVSPTQRRSGLDHATDWVREHHPEARALWKPWVIRDGRIVPAPASDLH